MRIYQCIHRYPAHIPAFEARWGIGEDSDFATIHAALLRDGFASVYRLVPPAARAGDEVFFTVWDYARLQHRWAAEHGLATRDLEEIRLAQIAAFRPDVVYDFSSFLTPDFARRVRAVSQARVIAWNGYLKSAEAPAPEGYHGFVSLHRPFVESWRRRGLPALELQPGIDPGWLAETPLPLDRRPGGLVFYGQVGNAFHNRADLLGALARSRRGQAVELAIHADCKPKYYGLGRRLQRVGITLPILARWPDARLAGALRPPRFGIGLYETIRGATAVLNTFTDLSVGFHSNMRIFETIGNGTPLVTPRGTYPEGLEEGRDYLAYETVEDVWRHAAWLRAEPEAGTALARAARDRMARTFGKDRQYAAFADFAAGL